MSKRKIKIEMPDEAFKNVSEDQKTELKDMLQKLFENFDPENPPGEPVVKLQKGATNCSKCNNKLKLQNTFELGEELFSLFYCSECDNYFQGEASN